MDASANVTKDSIYLTILKLKQEPILFENRDWFILFAKKPCNEGHLLVIPKMMVDKFYKLPTTILQEGFEIATKLSTLLERLYNPPQVFLFIKGFTNDDHAHIHVTPAYQSTDLDVDLTRDELSAEEMDILAQKLRGKIQETLR